MKRQTICGRSINESVPEDNRLPINHKHENMEAK